VKRMRFGSTEILAIHIALVLLALAAGETGAAFEGITADSRTAGMGDCLSASSSGARSLAPLPPSRFSGTVSFSYCAPFGVEELAEKSVVCSVPFRRKVLAVGLVERGESLYEERILSVSASGRPLARVSVSICLGLYSVSVSRLHKKRFVGLSGGARVRPIGSLEACAGVDNFVASRSERALPQTLLFGLLIMPASDVTVSAEMRKSAEGSSCLHFGVELVAEGGVCLRCGLETEPVQLAAGLGLELGPVSLETASSFHPVLGRTDVLTLTWRGKEGCR